MDALSRLEDWILAVMLLFASAQLLAQSPSHDYGPHPSSQDEIGSHLHFLNELGHRRRSNTLFHNEQSIDRGVQLSYVNVGQGNLTFARRDLVIPGHIPLVMARVYDSSALANSDFGPGWRIAAAESVQIRGSRLHLHDETGSIVAFRWNRAREFEPEVPHSSPVVSIRRVADDELRAELQGGWTRTFRLDGTQYRLVSVSDRFGNSISLSYTDGLLQRMSSPTGRFILLTALRARDDKASSR